jgi:ParB family chromosome partitioning protein
VKRSSDLLTTNLSLNQLELGVFTPRLQADSRYIDELAEDMQLNGQQKPIICRPHPEKPEIYQVVDGEYRVRAARKLGWTQIRAELRMLTDEEASLLAITINEIHGKRLDPVEEAMHIQKMMEKYGYTETEVAKKMRKSQEWVSRRLQLVRKTSSETEKAVMTRVIKPTHVREIVKLPVQEQKEVVEEIVEHGLSTRATGTLVEALTTEEKPEEKQRVLEVIPKLETKKAKAVVEALKRSPPEKRVEILSKPVDFYAVVKTPEQVKRVLSMAPEAAIIQFFDCPCGCGYRLEVDWVEQKARWLKYG